MHEVARSRLGVLTWLAPPGALVDAGEVDALQAQIESCEGANELQIVVDLANVSLVSSRLLELLLDAQDRLSRIGGGIRLAHASATVADVLRLTNLTASVPLIDEESAAERPDLHVVPNGRLGDVLVGAGLVTEDDVGRAVELQRSQGGRLGSLLVELGALSEHDLLEVLGRQLGMACVRLRTGAFDPETARSLTVETARRLGVVPLFRVRDTLFLATSNPQAIPSMDAVAEIIGAKVRPVLAAATDIETTIRDAHVDDHDLSSLMGDLDAQGDLELIEEDAIADQSTIDEIASGSPVINLINGLIQRAVRDGASDIHIEPGRKKTRVRFRIDGLLYQVMAPPADVHPALVSRLKVMANLDIAERRLPQDGRLQVYTSGRTIDLRFSSLPGIFGEKVVLRILDKDKSLTDIGALGMSDENLGQFKDLLRRSHGLLLVTGPTGSGKTTTLYAGIGHINSIEKSIVTIEDPVEYQLDLINQNQVSEQTGLGFAKILKHVLRQDPDIVMVGEIRERETAEIAVQAALTGHLVLSTLHTNDSAGAITRLLDMGIEPFLLSSALAGVMAQRLIRTVCPECKTSIVAPPGVLERFGFDDTGKTRLYHGRGCDACYDSGYKGRAPIHELLVTDASTQRLMVAHPSREQLAEHIRERGIRTLLDAGVQRAIDGVTTIEEVTRVVNG